MPDVQPHEVRRFRVIAAVVWLATTSLAVCIWSPSVCMVAPMGLMGGLCAAVAVTGISRGRYEPRYTRNPEPLRIYAGLVFVAYTGALLSVAIGGRLLQYRCDRFLGETRAHVGTREGTVVSVERHPSLATRDTCTLKIAPHENLPTCGEKCDLTLTCERETVRRSTATCRVVDGAIQARAGKDTGLELTGGRLVVWSGAEKGRLPWRVEVELSPGMSD